MIDSHNIMQPPFSCQRDLFLHGSDQQSLCACILDAINNEIDVIVSLYSEGTKLLEAMDDEINKKEIATIINDLNNQLYQYAISTNALKYRCGRENNKD